MSRSALKVGRPWLLNGVAFPILTCATMGAAKAAVEGVYHVYKKGSISADDFESTLKKMGEESVYWGMTAGVFAVTNYGLELVFCNHDDLVNLAIASTVTAALIYGPMKMNKALTLMDYIVDATIMGAASFAQSRIRCK